MEWGRILTVFWAIRLHRIEVVFKGRVVSANRVEHDVGNLVSSWCRGTCRVEGGAIW